MAGGHSPGDEVTRIREQIDHPIIDGDGHIIEYLPLVRDILVDLAGPSVAERFDLVVNSGRLTQVLSPDERRAMALMRRAVVGHSDAQHARPRDRDAAAAAATNGSTRSASTSRSLYPTYGLTAIHLHRRRAAAGVSRAFNTYVAEVYAPYRDRIAPRRVHPDVHARRGRRRARVTPSASSGCAP